MKCWVFGIFAVMELAGGCPADMIGEWWGGSGAAGKWFGAREELTGRGLTLGGKWLGSVYGVVGGGLERRATFDQEMKLEARLDIAQATGWEGLEGLTAVGGVRLREGENVNDSVGASPAFNPSSYQGGMHWRLLPFYLTYTTPELFGVPNFLTISGGWQNPFDFFARQEDAKLFRNNVIVSGKGISSNGVGWSSSYAAWGGMVKVASTSLAYAQGGIYMAIPHDADTSNHGLELAGAQPWNQNGWYVLAESGVTPKLAGLSGKYALGGYYWGLENTSFSGGECDGRFGFYAMAEQRLFRESDSGIEMSGGRDADGKSRSLPGASKESGQGLRWLGFVNYAPDFNNCLPIFFYTGFVYEGLIPARDHDQAGVALAFGNYSQSQIRANCEAGNPVLKTHEGVLEFEYRVQVNRWSFIQPFLQYVIRPGGDGEVANATVLGVHFGVTF